MLDANELGSLAIQHALRRLRKVPPLDSARPSKTQESATLGFSTPFEDSGTCHPVKKTRGRAT